MYTKIYIRCIVRIMKEPAFPQKEPLDQDSEQAKAIDTGISEVEIQKEVDFLRTLFQFIWSADSLQKVRSRLQDFKGTLAEIRRDAPHKNVLWDSLKIEGEDADEFERQISHLTKDILPKAVAKEPVFIMDAVVRVEKYRTCWPKSVLLKNQQKNLHNFLNWIPEEVRALTLRQGMEALNSERSEYEATESDQGRLQYLSAIKAMTLLYEAHVHCSPQSPLLKEYAPAIHCFRVLATVRRAAAAINIWSEESLNETIHLIDEAEKMRDRTQEKIVTDAEHLSHIFRSLTSLDVQLRNMRARASNLLQQFKITEQQPPQLPEGQ